MVMATVFMLPMLLTQAMSMRNADDHGIMVTMTTMLMAKMVAVMGMMVMMTITMPMMTMMTMTMTMMAITMMMMMLLMMRMRMMMMMLMLMMMVVMIVRLMHMKLVPMMTTMVTGDDDVDAVMGGENYDVIEDAGYDDGDDDDG